MKSILLARTELRDRERIKTLLPLAQFDIIEANNGAEAFAAFRIQSFDLVIVDYELPFIPGNELALLIRQVDSAQPILMLSSVPRKVGADNPVDLFLHKSCNDKRLVAEIVRLTDRSGYNHEHEGWNTSAAPERPSAVEVPA